MASKYSKRDGVWTFNCDGSGCHRNFEASEGNDFRMGWREATAAGWVNSVEYEGNIARWRHFCPECKKQMRD